MSSLYTKFPQDPIPVSVKNNSWWRHQMEKSSALLAICAGNSPVTGEFSTQRPVTRSFDVFFHLRLNKQLSKQSWGFWFETLSRPLWRHCNVPKTVHLVPILGLDFSDVLARITCGWKNIVCCKIYSNQQLSLHCIYFRFFIVPFCYTMRILLPILYCREIIIY